MLRFILSWSASSSDFATASLDVTAAFLNAPLPKGRIVALRPPTVLYKLQLLPPGHVWLVHKAIYGLREAPQLWSEERTETITKTTFASEGDQYCILLSEIHKSLCLITKKSSLLKKPSTDRFGLTSKVLPRDVVRPDLPCEIAEANFRQFQWFSPQILVDFQPPFRLILLYIFNQFQSVLISFINQFPNQFDSVNNADIY